MTISEMERYKRRGWPSMLVNAVRCMAPIYDLIESREGQFSSLEYFTLDESIAKDFRLVDKEGFSLSEVLEAARKICRFDSFLLPVDRSETDTYWRFTDAVFDTRIRAGLPIYLQSDALSRSSDMAQSLPDVVSLLQEEKHFILLERKVSKSEVEIILRRQMPMKFVYETVLTASFNRGDVIWSENLMVENSAPFRFPVSLFSGMSDKILFDGNEIDKIRKKLAFSIAFSREVERCLRHISDEIVEDF